MENKNELAKKIVKMGKTNLEIFNYLDERITKLEELINKKEKEKK